MGWNNPPVRWSDVERALSGKPYQGDGGDSPAWTHHRERYTASPEQGLRVDELGMLQTRTPYVELHAHSNFSFLDGAAKELGVRTVFGSELSVGLSQPQNGIPDPEGEHLLLLALRETGYRRSTSPSVSVSGG